VPCHYDVHPDGRAELFGGGGDPLVGGEVHVVLQAAPRAEQEDVRYDPPEGRVDHYDLLVIGGGAAGINALKQGVKLGARVALVDTGPLGGACINRG
jgi:NADPH-dependent 2,4-dienoyl-CoA reductase/sulfur reductase-like enzyme